MSLLLGRTWKGAIFGGMYLQREINVRICSCMSRWACVHVCGRQRTFDVIPWEPSAWFFETGSQWPTAHWQTSLAGWNPLVSFLQGCTPTTTSAVWLAAVVFFGGAEDQFKWKDFIVRAISSALRTKFLTYFRISSFLPTEKVSVCVCFMFKVLASRFYCVCVHAFILHTRMLVQGEEVSLQLAISHIPDLKPYCVDLHWVNLQSCTTKLFYFCHSLWDTVSISKENS